MRLLFSLGAIAALVSCVSARSVLEEFQPGAVEDVDVSSLGAIDDATAGRVVVDEDVVRFDEVDGVVVARHLNRRVARIHGARGQDLRYADVVFDRTFTTVEAFFVRSYDPQGRAHVYGDKEILEVPMLGTDYLYSDTRVRRVLVPEQPRGGVVEVVSLVRMTQPELFAFAGYFGNFVDVDVARFVVEQPEGWDVEVSTESGGVPTDWQPATSTVNGRTRRVWEKRKVPAVIAGDDAPHLSDVVDRVTVRLRKATTKAGVVVEGPKDIQDLSRVTARLMKGRDTVTPAISAVVKEVLGDAPTTLPQRERAAKLYAWTRDSIRYCSVSIGMGGWVPHDASAVEDVRYGDCKDKANLLKSLLRAVDVNARIVTIRAGAASSPFRLPVVAGNFNHAILVVDLDDGPVFVDPTTRTVAFADLPPADEERLCLPVDENGSDLVMTPSSSLDRDKRVTTWTLRADDKGGLAGDVVSTLEGFHADELRQALLEEADEDKNRVIARHLGSNALSIKTPKIDAAAPPVEVTPVVVHAVVADDLKAAGRDELAGLLNGQTFLRDATVTLPANRPAFDVVLGSRSDVVDEVRLRLPKQTGVRQVPAPKAGDSALFAWSVAWTVEGDELVLRHRVQHKVARVATADVAAFRADVDSYRRAFTARVVLEKIAQKPESK